MNAQNANIALSFLRAKLETLKCREVIPEKTFLFFSLGHHHPAQNWPWFIL
jgi:hypothetical protein